MSADDPQPGDLLDRLLNDLVAARPLSPDDPSPAAEAAVAARTLYALDAADPSPNPDPLFLRRLEASLMDHAAPTPSQRLLSAPRISPNSRYHVPKWRFPRASFPIDPVPRRPWWPIIETAAACFLILVVVGGYLAATRQLPGLPAPNASRGPAAVAPLAATPAAGAAPVRLRIAAIGVDAPIESVSAPATLQNQAPGGPWVVSWYNGTSPLGVGGNTLLVGHFDYGDTGPAVFWGLRDLELGEEVEVFGEDGDTVTFAVTSKRLYKVADLDAETNADILRPTGEETLTLVTEAGEFDYDVAAYLERLVVRATPVPNDPVSISSVDETAVTAAERSTPVFPDPSACTVTPRPIDDFRALAEGSPQRRSFPPGSPIAIPLDEGEPADPATVAAITATVREWIACGNAGDGLRVPAFYTDRLLRDAFVPPDGEYAWDPDFDAMETTPATPRPEGERVSVLAVRDVRLLPDGRVRAQLEIGLPPSVDDAFSTVVTLAEENGRYLLDEINDDPALGTPTP